MSAAPETARTIILYGDSGLGKSENARAFAKLAYEVTGLPVRLISHEVSSQTVFADLVRAGIVVPYWFFQAKNPLPAMRRLSAGDWPVRLPDGTWKWEPWKGGVGAYIYEGLTTASEMLLEDGRDKQRMTAEQKEKAFKESEGGQEFMFAKSSMSNFDFVQSEMLRNLKAFGGLPIWRMLWTSHEAKGEDEDTKAAIRGPGLVGKAKTGAVQRYCSLLLHIEGYPTTEKVSDEKGGTLEVVRTKRRIWFEPHPDALFSKITYPAKVTVPAASLAKLHKRFPSGYFVPEKPAEGGLELVNSLADFMRFEETLVNEVTDATVEWKRKVDAARAATTSNVTGEK